MGKEARSALTKQRTVGVSLALIVASFLIFTICAYYVQDNIAKSITNAIAATILAIGIISFSYEIFMRDTITKEVLSIVGIKESITKNQILWAGRESTIDWSSIIKEGNEIHLLLTETTWLDQHWSDLQHQATLRRININLLLPKPDGRNISNIATYLSTSMDDLSNKISESSDKIEMSWKDALSNENLEAGSKLQIFHYEEIPFYSLISNGQSIAATFFRPISKKAYERGFSVIFKGSTKDYPISWFLEELAHLTKANPSYVNEVKYEQQG